MEEKKNNEERFCLTIGGETKYLNAEEVQREIDYLEISLRHSREQQQTWYKFYTEEFSRYNDACEAMNAIVDCAIQISKVHTDHLKSINETAKPTL